MFGLKLLLYDSGRTTTSCVLYVFPALLRSANLAKAKMSQFCTMPTGERKQRAAAICREVHGTNGMINVRLETQANTD